jgi:L-rhamnose mutarotase
MTQRYCFALDLKDDNQLIEDYKKYHARGGVWPEVIDSIRSVGITGMEIFLVGNRLFMIMDVNESFSFDKKMQADIQNPKVQEWETLMSTFQQELPWAAKGHKWELMGKIFDLKKH